MDWRKEYPAVAKRLRGLANADTPDEGEWMVKDKSGAVAERRKSAPEADELTPEQQAVAGRTSKLLQSLIKKRWRGKNKGLADKAGIDASKLSVLKTKGTHKSIPSFVDLCMTLGVDPDNLLLGKVVNVEPPTRRNDLHAMLERVIGTPDEPAVEQVLRAFVKSRQH